MRNRKFRLSNKVLLVTAVTVSLLWACRKVVSETDLKKTDNAVFERNPNLKGAFTSLNAGYADDSWLDKTIVKYQELDQEQRFSGELRKKFGVPLWDIGIAFKNENNLKTIVVPFEKQYDGRDLLLLAYFETRDKVVFRLIDNKTKQKKLLQNVGSDNSTFSLNTLNWLFKTSQDNKLKFKINNSIANTNSEQNLIRSNSVIVQWDCWFDIYWDAEGYETTQTRCRYNIVFTQQAVTSIEGYPDAYFLGYNYFPNYSDMPEVIKDSSLEKFPCAKSLIDSLFVSDDSLTKLIGGIFNVNENFNIKFKIDSSLVGSTIDGYTFSSGHIDPYQFSSTIRLNPTTLSMAYKDYIFSTLLHEAIHSYIDYYFKQYLENINSIDSNYIKEKFPIFWQSKPVENLNNNELQHHNQMAEKYINLFTASLKAYNPNIPENIANALAWGGLSKTTAWKLKNPNDTTFINNVNWNARSTQNQHTQTDEVWINKLKKCN